MSTSCAPDTATDPMMAPVAGAVTSMYIPLWAGTNFPVANNNVMGLFGSGNHSSVRDRFGAKSGYG